MVLMIVVAQFYGVLQLAILGWTARSLRWRVLVVAVLAGLYGASALAFTLQWAWTRAYAALSGRSLNSIVNVAGYTVDPFIEEFAKVAPVAVVWLLFRAVRREWGYTDVLLACAAVGSGFGLARTCCVLAPIPA